MSNSQDDRAKLPRAADLRFDICRDVEQVLKIGRDYQNKDGYRGAHYDTVKLLCDTIEYQQERLETKTEVGDRAKLREALVKAREVIKAMGGYWERETLLPIDVALVSPQRNCDRFADELDAQLAFLNEVWLILIARETMTEQDAYENWTDEMRARYGRWLLAPATEQRGDNDGSK